MSTINDKLTKLKTTKPFQTVMKNWIVFASIALLILVWQSNMIPALFRAVIQVPMFLFIILGSYLILRSVFCRNTTDALGDNAKAVREGWAQMSRADQVKLLIFERVGFMIAGSIIVAGILIIYGGISGSAAAL